MEWIIGTHIIFSVFGFNGFERLVGRVERGADQPDGEIEGPRHVSLVSLSQAGNSPPSEFDYLIVWSAVH